MIVLFPAQAAPATLLRLARVAPDDAPSAVRPFLAHGARRVAPGLDRPLDRTPFSASEFTRSVGRNPPTSAA